MNNLCTYTLSNTRLSYIFLRFTIYTFTSMSGWFVYQRDVFPPAMDPDTLGAKLVPEYDHKQNLIYLDNDGPEHNGLRRIRSRWGVDPDIVQMDIVMHREWSDTPLHTPHGPALRSSRLSRSVRSSTHQSMRSSMETLVWTPSKEYICFTNHRNGFQLENRTSGWCVDVAQDPTTHTQYATLLAQSDTCTDPVYTQMVGVVVGIRLHTLTLVAPGSSSWFARQVTAQTTSLVDTPIASRSAPHSQSHSQPHSPPYMTFSTADSFKTSCTPSNTPSNTPSVSPGGIAYRRKPSGSRVATIHTHPPEPAPVPAPVFRPSSIANTPKTDTSPVTPQTAHRVAHQMVQQQHISSTMTSS